MDLPTTSHVRDVLRYLARDRAPKATPLADLLLVRRQVASAGLRPTADACTHEIGCLITEIVEEELEALRARHETSPRGSQHDWLQQLVADFRSGHQELESWSAIYHVYLRPDLNLTLGNLEALLGDRHRRTIQRRLQHGIESLTIRMQALEREATARTAPGHTTDWPPAAWDWPCIGRGPLIRSVTQQLTRQDHRRVTALAGSPGIGKSAVALQVAGAFSEPPAAFDVVWVDARREADALGDGTALERRIAGRIGHVASCRAPRTSGGALVLLVVDAIDDPALATAIVREAVALPPTVAVLLAGRVGWPASERMLVTAVQPLPVDATLQMIRHEAAERGLRSLVAAGDDDVRALADALGGHPGAVRAATAELGRAAVADVAAAFRAGTGPAAVFVESLWLETWARAGESCRRVVTLVVTHEGDGHRADAVRLQRTWEADAPSLRHGLREAVENGLLTQRGSPGHPTYESALFLGRFVRNRARAEALTRRPATALASV